MGLDQQAAAGAGMKRGALLLTSLGITTLLLAASMPVRERLIWNRTASVPEGLYWLSDGAYGAGDVVAVSSGSAASRWAAARGFTGPDWPLLKQVAGMPGDTICREDGAVSLNGMHIGTARVSAQNGVFLPVWSGCRTVGASEVFLMNAHPRSLDGRYFGMTRRSDIDGRAILVFPAWRAGWGKGGMARRTPDQAGEGHFRVWVRARYKDVRTRTSKALSAHRFSVCGRPGFRQTLSGRMPVLSGDCVSYILPVRR